VRSVDEWVGKSDDAAIPERVKLRIWVRCEGRCHITGRKILPGDAYDFDHIRALCNGGAHRESNLAPALRAKHREKTALDLKTRAKTDAIAKKHAGIRTKSRLTHPTLKRTMDGRVVSR
jgi:5-methylcytosine-specific restriction endonuclease McrA